MWMKLKGVDSPSSSPWSCRYRQNLAPRKCAQSNMSRIHIMVIMSTYSGMSRCVCLVPRFMIHHDSRLPDHNSSWAFHPWPWQCSCLGTSSTDLSLACTQFNYIRLQGTEKILNFRCLEVASLDRWFHQQIPRWLMILRTTTSTDWASKLVQSLSNASVESPLSRGDGGVLSSRRAAARSRWLHLHGSNQTWTMKMYDATITHLSWSGKPQIKICISFVCHFRTHTFGSVLVFHTCKAQDLSSWHAWGGLAFLATPIVVRWQISKKNGKVQWNDTCRSFW